MIEKKHEENEHNDQTARKGQLRKISREELKEILEKHRRWIKSEKKEGEQANLAYTDLRRTDFTRILPGEIILAEAIFRGARLNNAKLKKADLTGADFSDANLNKAQLKKAILTQARLVNTDLSESILKKAKFDEAILHGADFRGAIGLKLKQISSAQIDWRTIFSENLKDLETTIPHEELRTILVEHKRWLQSNGEYGQQADLTKARMRGVNLQALDVPGVTLERAELARADLRGAVLDGVNMRAADLLETNIRGASLIDADLTDAKRFSAAQLGLTNVCGAKLSEPIREFKELNYVENACKNARRVFGLMILLCVYFLFTIMPLTDLQLLTGSSFSILPVVGISIHIELFLLITPIILFATYFYFHLYMHRLWEALADLPSFFPDGTSLDKRAYPWLGIYRARMISSTFRLKGGMSRTLESLTIGLLSGVAVPWTLIWVRAILIKYHEWNITSLHILSIVLSFWVIMISAVYEINTIRNGYWNTRNILKCSSIRHNLPAIKTLWGGAYFPVLLGVVLLISSYRNIEGPISELVFHEKVCSQNLRKGRSYLNVDRKDISPKPDNWSDDTSKISTVNGAYLQGKNIRWAKAKGAFLVNANLREIKARGVDFQQADLRGADLTDAELRCVNFEGASLRDADFRGADLTDAIGLDCAQLNTAIIDSTTILPGYIVNPPTGPPCITQ